MTLYNYFEGKPIEVNEAKMIEMEPNALYDYLLGLVAQADGRGYRKNPLSVSLYTEPKKQR